MCALRLLPNTFHDHRCALRADLARSESLPTLRCYYCLDHRLCSVGECRRVSLSGHFHQKGSIDNGKQEPTVGSPLNTYLRRSGWNANCVKSPTFWDDQAQSRFNVPYYLPVISSLPRGKCDQIDCIREHQLHLNYRCGICTFSDMCADTSALTN